jgi:hypothetical protein
MPTQHRLGLDHLNHAKQIWPELDHPSQQKPIDVAHAKPRRRLLQYNVQLMAEKQILGFEPAVGLEQVADEYCERMQDRKHRS